MTQTVYVGIDPGAKGAIAAIFPDGTVWSEHVPYCTKRKKVRGKTKGGKSRYKTESHNYDFLKMFRMLRRFAKAQSDDLTVVVALERQQGMRHDNKRTATAVGRSQGIWEALIGAAKLPTPRRISPGMWKVRYVPRGAPKKASVVACLKLYPKADLPLVKDEARAEAILIADYVLRQDQGLEYPFAATEHRKRVSKIIAGRQARRKRRRGRR